MNRSTSLFIAFLLIGACLCEETTSPVNNGSDYIISGQVATGNQFPYQVSLRRMNNFHFCGGSIISNYWVLTAAHCVYELGGQPIYVVAGSKDLGNSGAFHQSSYYIYHPSYNPSYPRGDVALIRVDRPFQYTQYIRPVTLPNSDIRASSPYAVVAGWGSTNPHYTQIPYRLQYITTYLMPWRDCYNSLGPMVHNTHVCTQNPQGRGNCFGDSGGPLVADGVQVGVVSFIYWQCGGGYPDVYARVWSFMPWIRSVARV